MRQLTTIILLLACALARGQQPTDSVVVNTNWSDTAYKLYFYANMNVDSMDKADLDTIPVWVTYVDTTMTTGSKTVKDERGVWRVVYYRFPVHPEVKYRGGFAIVFKRATNELTLVNDYTKEYWPFTTLKYLDEARVPFPKKYFVLLTKALNFDYGIP